MCVGACTGIQRTVRELSISTANSRWRGEGGMMTVAYTDYQGSEFSLQLVNYRAWVEWNNGNPSLTGITNFNSGDPPTIVKQKPSASWYGSRISCCELGEGAWAWLM